MLNMICFHPMMQIMSWCNKILNLFVRDNQTAMDLMKDLFWFEIKGGKLGVHFTRKKHIGNYTVDFYCREKKLAVIIYGWLPDDGYECDGVMYEYLKSRGIRLIMISDKDVRFDMPNVLTWVKKNIKEL